MRTVFAITAPRGAGASHLAVEVVTKLLPRAMLIDEHRYGLGPRDREIRPERYICADWHGPAAEIRLNERQAEKLRGVTDIVLVAHQMAAEKAQHLADRQGARVLVLMFNPPKAPFPVPDDQRGQRLAAVREAAMQAASDLLLGSPS